MKLNKNQFLFAGLMLGLTESLYEDSEKDINGLLQEEKKNRDEILLVIASTMLYYPIVDNKMNLTRGDYLKNKDSMGKLIKSKLSRELNNEVAATKNIIGDVADNKYNINNYLTGKDYKKIDDKVVNKLINEKVKDKTVNDRIKNNKNEVYKHTQKRIDDFLKGKISVNDIEKEVKALYNSNAYNTKRLVQDQIARAQAKANEEWFKENNVEWVLYDATLDGNTCSDCGKLDGKTYETNSDRPSIPKHVGCRCCYIGLPDKDWRPDKRLDQMTSENIDYKTYKEWVNSKEEVI